MAKGGFGKQDDDKYRGSREKRKEKEEEVKRTGKRTL